MEKFRILTIDGGGLRGVVPLTILKKVEEKIAEINAQKGLKPQKIWEYFDLIAGTSTGGLITCAITLKDPLTNSSKYSLNDIMEIYINRGKEIFPQYNGLQKLLHNITDIFSPSFSDKGIKKVFRDVVGNARLKDCLKPIMISTYDLTNNIPLFFKWTEAQADENLNAELYDICRSTSAGPTYLPGYNFFYPKNPDTENPDRNCIDGGVYVNNPALAALAEFSKNHKYYLPSTSTDTDIDYRSVFVLSIGTGSHSTPIYSNKSKNKGELFWAKAISDIMMRGVNLTTDYEMNEMMEKNNYLRLTIDIDNDEHAIMTNSSKETMDYLIKATQSQVTTNSKKLNEIEAFLHKAS